MMSKHEFISGLHANDRNFFKWLFIWMIALALWAMGAALLDNFLGFPNSTLRYAYCFLGIAVFGAGFIHLLAGTERGMPCPHCHKRLFQIPGQITIATGICCYCGERIFEQPTSVHFVP
jgi:hypothetical protein